MSDAKRNLKCKVFGHSWNDFARSWERLDGGEARIKHKQCKRCQKWDYDQIIKQEQPSVNFDSFTTDRKTIIGLNDSSEKTE